MPSKNQSRTGSLRWRLQLWHAIILISAITLFGIGFYHQFRQATINEIDAGLLAGARVIEGSLRGSAPEAGDLQNPETFDRITIDLPFRQGQRPRDLRPQRDRPMPERRDPPRRRHHRRPEMYFVIFSDGGKPLHSRTSDDLDIGDIDWQRTRSQFEFRNVRNRREVMLRGPHGTLIVVGHEITDVRRMLSRTLLMLVGLGTAVSALGLVGGWWLTGTAIEPIRRITETTRNVTARSLSERIDTSRMDSELQSLGSALNEMLQRLETSFQKQTQFTSDASHELRTPVAVLMTHTELAINRPRSNEELVETIRTCRHAAQRMESLVERLLILARSDSQQLRLQISEFDLLELAVETAEMFRPFADEKNIQIQAEGDSAICSADRQRIGQVIGNLVHNAIIYNHTDGKVVLKTWSIGESVHLSVRDTGCGIDRESLPRLFDRFFRVDEARSRTSQEATASGLGLGLAISQSIISSHGGTLTVGSEIGVGTEFELRLPRRIDAIG